MNPSLFIEYIDKYFRLVIGKITEKINGKKTEEQLLHKTMLTEEYSADLTWGSTELNTSIVAADVVALDSTLPLKRRDKISNASGVIPKLGIKFRKGEKAISDINVMRARGADEATIAGKIFDDAPKAIKGVDVRKEIMFQQALSTGVTLIEDDESNTGTGIRADFGYLAANTFRATTAKWGGATATPQDDVQQLFDKAQEDGNSIGLVMLSKKYFNYFRNSTQGKRLAANYRNVSFDANTILPVPSRETMLEALADEYGAPFRVVDSSFKIEKPDGTRVSVKPWEEGNIIALPGENVGRLVYGTLAEETNTVAGVNYQKSGSHILVAKYSKTDPLREFTTAQALAIPVIDGVDGIYILHADTGVLSVDPTSLSFAKSANTTGKTFTVHSDSTFAVASSGSWATATINGEEVIVKVTANTGGERTATITVTDANSQTATVTVTQADGTV
jgi:hypothetical protein